MAAQGAYIDTCNSTDSSSMDASFKSAGFNLVYTTLTTLRAPLTQSQSGGNSVNDHNAEKRATHNAVERARRESLNYRFQELAGVIPSLNSVRKPSKTVIIQRSLEHVHELRRRIEIKDRTLAMFRQQISELKSEINKTRVHNGFAPLTIDIPDEDQLMESALLERDTQQRQKKRHQKFFTAGGLPILTRNTSISSDVMLNEFQNIDDEEEDDQDSMYISSSIPSGLSYIKEAEMGTFSPFDPNSFEHMQASRQMRSSVGGDTQMFRSNANQSTDGIAFSHSLPFNRPFRAGSLVIDGHGSQQSSSGIPGVTSPMTMSVPGAMPPMTPSPLHITGFDHIGTNAAAAVAMHFQQTGFHPASNGIASSSTPPSGNFMGNMISKVDLSQRPSWINTQPTDNLTTRKNNFEESMLTQLLHSSDMTQQQQQQQQQQMQSGQGNMLHSQQHHHSQHSPQHLQQSQFQYPIQQAYSQSPYQQPQQPQHFQSKHPLAQQH
ncbi:hypothetical protein BDEG_24135 [Batrachochytrium dendrobatidis JEL423]|uniref:BHLH domain-containing protein n=1 Tax=Batrachochytrium dendrobatidis (strain JEL423) TaxID=403673 RepID=A0A177WKQ1_BATDL|nr:hypothetical protein BDEG_24135 [Batrachochytrium dendrobatidis JEL423]